jgi:hypothetical protein
MAVDVTAAAGGIPKSDSEIGIAVPMGQRSPIVRNRTWGEPARPGLD